jgi:hypothetical protein
MVPIPCILTRSVCSRRREVRWGRPRGRTPEGGCSSLCVDSRRVYGANVWAWVEPQQGKRSDLDEKSSKFTDKGFAELGIRGWLAALACL